MELSQLTDGWKEYVEIAQRFEGKADYQDREDLRHSIIVRLADVAREYQIRGKVLTKWGMLRVAVYTVHEYWYQRRKWARLASLNSVVQDEDGNEAELMSTIADDNAIDLEAWVDAKTWLLGCPRRLITIAHKRVNGIALTDTDKGSLSRFRKNGQKRLL